MDDSDDRVVFNTMANNKMAGGRRVEGGYQPRAQSGVKPADLKRPKGGSAIKRPSSKESPPSKASE